MRSTVCVGLGVGFGRERERETRGGRERERERETRGLHHPEAHDLKDLKDREKRDGPEAGVTPPPAEPL